MFEVGTVVSFDCSDDGSGTARIVESADSAGDYWSELITGSLWGYIPGGSNVYINHKSITGIVTGDTAIFKYEVKAGVFVRTYDNEGKAIAVARALRDYINSQPETGRDQVSLTKTPINVVSEKVNF